MIDKVELRVPAGTAFRPKVQAILRELPYANFDGRVRKARYYQGVVDVRDVVGSDALLHVNYKFADRKDHKLELLQTGGKSLSEMRDIVCDVFDCDPDALAVMRVDLAADLRDVPLEQVRAGLRVKFKRSFDERGELEFEEVGGRRLEYFRYGKAPNCVRVYDKTRERQARLPQIRKRLKQTVSFEDAFGFPEETMLTRIERQAGGGRVPPEIDTFGKLRSAADFNPFTSLEVVPVDFVVPDPKRVGVATMQKIAGTKYIIDRFGYQNARAMFNVEGNAARQMQPFLDYVRDCREQSFTERDILESYRESTLRQFS